MLPNCTANFLTTKLYGDTSARYQTLRQFFLFPNSRAFAHFLNYQTVRGHTTRLHGVRRLRILWASVHFLTTRLHVATTLMMAAFFPVENRSFSVILYTYYTLAFTATRPLLLLAPKFTWRLLTIFWEYQTVRGYVTKQQGGGLVFGGFCPFLTTRLQGGNHPDCGCFFPRRKPIIFNIISMHLLHSCLHCDLYHSCSILHKSRNCFWQIFFRLPECTGAHEQTARWLFSNFCATAHFLTTRLHGGYHPDNGSIFSRRKPILFNNIIMHLIHSYTHFDFKHSCSTLHKARDLHLA